MSKQKSESDKTREFCAQLKKLGVKVIAVVGSKMQMPGVPDRYFAAKGFPGGSAWVEFKQPTGTIDPVQKQMLSHLRQRGVLAVIYWYELGLFTDEEAIFLGQANYKNPSEWLEELKAIGRRQQA